MEEHITEQNNESNVEEILFNSLLEEQEGKTEETNELLEHTEVEQKEDTDESVEEENLNAVASEEQSEELEQEASEELDEDEEVEENHSNPNKGLLKRIDKLTAIRRSVEEENEQLKNELNSLKNTKQSSKIIDNPLEDILSIEDLNNLENNSKVLFEEVSDAIDSANRRGLDDEEFAYTDKSGREYTVSELISLKKTATRYIQDYIPDRKIFIHNKQQSENKAVSEFSWYKDKDSNELKIASKLYNQPNIKRMVDSSEDGAYMLGLLVEGIKVKENTKPKPKLDKTKLKKAPTPSISPSNPSGSSKNINSVMSKNKLKQLEDNFNKSGNKEDLIKLFEAELN